jgi:hypothetical protein
MLLAEIRHACAEVARRARLVRLNEACLADYARALPLEHLHPSYDIRHHYLGSPEATVAYLLTLDAINFGSGYFPLLNKRPGLSGYFTVAVSLKEVFEQDGPLSAEALRDLSVERCAAMFGQTHTAGLPLMRLFSQALNDLGSYLLERFDGSFTALVAAAEHSAERLVRLLLPMPYFQDVSDYQGLRVPFYKRAQIAASDLALAFGGQGYGRFDDLAALTIFADNLVPHVLRVDGLLTYDEELAARIARGELLEAGSLPEIEIRAVAVHAVERLVAVLREGGSAVTAQQLDILLWSRGQEAHYKALPRHRTRTVFY